MAKVILLFEVSKEKETLIQNMAKNQNIKVKPVPFAFYEEAIGFLAGVPGKKKKGTRYTGEPLGEEMLIFSGLGSGDLDVFLENYRMAKIPKIDLKAIVTEHNIGWTPIELMEELQKERDAYKSGDKS